MKVVLDTNILISGIGRPEGAPGQIVSAWLEGKFDLVVSEALLDEFRRVLLYPIASIQLTGIGHCRRREACLQDTKETGIRCPNR